MMLADTSVWVNHLRGGEQPLALALEEGRVLMHPFVLGELACGNLRNRGVVLRLMARLPMTPRVPDHEVRGFIERHALMGRGIGYIDASLLAAAAVAHAVLWTCDRRLHAAAKELKLA